MKFRTPLLWFPAIVLLFATTGCRVTLEKKWVNLNVVFSKDLSTENRNRLISDLKRGIGQITQSSAKSTFSPGRYTQDSSIAYILGYIDSSISTLPLESPTRGQKARRSHVYKLNRVQDQTCSCNDSLLWNFYADLTIEHSGTGTPVTTRPKPKPVPVQGGSVQYVGKNDSIGKVKFDETPIDPSKKLDFEDGFTVLDTGFVAVIDTGIDSTLIDPRARQFILPYGDKGSRNTLEGGNKKDIRDNHIVRHGTSVTALLLQEFYRTSQAKQIPHIMVLKALDDNGEGSLFSLCCAISYAARASASLINISAGYYDTVSNGTLDYYLKMCRDSSVPVVVAAGNETNHDTSDVCTNAIKLQNLLTLGRPSSATSRGPLPEHMFYPAWESSVPDSFGVISVTGLRSGSPDTPCYFQNYSDTFVTVGVMNGQANPICCTYQPPFFSASRGIEGTSFATPIVSGRLASQVIKAGRTHDYDTYLRMINAQPGIAPTGTVHPPAKHYISD